MGADLDVCELHLSIKNFATRQPYVMPDGQTSLDMPVEGIEWTDVMFEAKVGDISSARIVLPSLLAFPGLRPLLQKIQEGDRVELFAVQPDCGDPVFAGFIPPEGISEENGNTTLNVVDTLGQLRWQHLRRFEYLNAPASGLYDRARMVWADKVAEQFFDSTAQNNYGLRILSGGAAIWGTGFVKLPSNGTPGCSFGLFSGDSPVLVPGDTYMLEADVTIQTAFSSSSLISQLSLYLRTFDGVHFIGGFLQYRGSGASGYPQLQAIDFSVVPTAGATYAPGSGTNQVLFQMPQSHHVAFYIHFNFDGTVSLYAYLDNVNVGFKVLPWNFDSTTYGYEADLQSDVSGDYVQMTSWRVRKLVSAINKAARWNPQTQDAVTYQPNAEENLQFLQLVAEKDNAEYRPIYHAWPQVDELEIDQAGTLGKFASRLLGYEQPPKLPTEGSPQASPLPVITDAASFLVAPPFRFEEGYNLEAPPKILPRANAHANDVIRVGASTADAQVFAEAWSSAETGRPQLSPSNSDMAALAGALYPYFEQITNDDRVGIQALNASLAGLELARRIDPTPSLELAVVEELPWAFRWRAGDQVFVKTQSLRFNLEQELRVQKIQYKAGSPLRIVTMGKTDWDPSMLRMLSEDTKMSWLYDQSGTSPTVYVYPFLGALAAGATSTAFTIQLDKFTTGSALVYAALHWFADANVMNLAPELNQGWVYTGGIIPASNTDSGLIMVTQYFQSPGQYSLSFKNNDANPRTLSSAFLVLRVKA
jgi:hypothetical protein